ncbi:MAG: LysR family transcriptional regulator [Pseudomonadota bacterium]
MRTIPDWNKLKTFYLTAEAKSFSAAAEKCGVSQSSISRQIGSLEQEIGSVLFNRNTKGLTLTEQGELLYDTAKHIYKKISETEDILITGRTVPKGTLKITTTTSFGNLWLSPILPKFVRQYPEIRVDLILEDNLVDLSRRDADIAIRMWRPIEPDLVSKSFLKVQCHFYASEEYIREMGEPKTPEDLDNHRLIAFSAPIAGLRNGLNMHLSMGRPPNAKHLRRAVFSANNLRSVFHATKAAIGISSLPDYMAKKASFLKRVLDDAPTKSFQTYIVYPYELRNTKRISVFRDFLKEHAKEWGY